MSRNRSGPPITQAMSGVPLPVTAPGLVAISPRRLALLERLEHRLGYQFRDPAVLDLALTHSSVAYEEQTEQRSQDDNEQLEFLGDAVLGLVVTEQLFRVYPEFTEGAWTRLRAQFVSRPHLARVAQAVDLGEFLRLGKGEEKSGGRKKEAILANAVEAVIAAVYLDGGMQSVILLVRSWLLDETLEAAVVAARAGEVGDYKSMLQEYFQAHDLGQPSYQVTAETGPDHRKSFVVAVKFLSPSGDGKTLASAAGTRKKHAEQEAARLALQYLRAQEPAPKLAMPENREPATSISGQKK